MVQCSLVDGQKQDDVMVAEKKKLRPAECNGDFLVLFITREGIVVCCQCTVMFTFRIEVRALRRIVPMGGKLRS